MTGVSFLRVQCWPLMWSAVFLEAGSALVRYAGEKGFDKDDSCKNSQNCFQPITQASIFNFYKLSSIFPSLLSAFPIVSALCSGERLWQRPLWKISTHASTFVIFSSIFLNISQLMFSFQRYSTGERLWQRLPLWRYSTLLAIKNSKNNNHSYLTK